MKPAGGIAALLAFALVSCASTPPVVVALPAPPAPAVARQLDANPRTTLTLRGVTLPGYLDSPGVVISRQANTLVFAEEAEWAERPRDGATRVLRDALSQRLGASRIVLRGEHRVPDAELIVEFLKLDPVNGALQLDAQWSFVCIARKGASHAGRTQLQTPLEAATATAVATATANALAKFADVLAAEAWCPADAGTTAQ